MTIVAGDANIIDVDELVDETGTIPFELLSQWALDMTLWCAAGLTPRRPNGWGRATAVAARKPGAAPLPGARPVRFMAGEAPAGELADHGIINDGASTPESHIYLATILNGRSLLDGADDVTDAATHEIGENAIDPWLNGCVQSPLGAIYALEVCDAVQGTGRRYGKTWCSNICLPAYFSPSPGDTRFDLHGVLTAPFTIAPEGYAQTYDSSTMRWKILNVERAAPKLATPTSRISRRAAKVAG